MQRLLTDLLDHDGLVRFNSVVFFHDHICRQYGFGLARMRHSVSNLGGRHLFYVQGKILLRVKTTGTQRRPTAHMTISLATGLDWPDEIAKVSRSGDLIPKRGTVPRADWRALRRLGNSLQAIESDDDRWVEACHFDFVEGFDATGAAALLVP